MTCDYDLDGMCYCQCVGPDPLDEYSICPRHAGKECESCAAYWEGFGTARGHRGPVGPTGWDKTVEDYNIQSGDEVRCINCDRRICYSPTFEYWFHFDTDMSACRRTFAAPPTNYRP